MFLYCSVWFVYPIPILLSDRDKVGIPVKFPSGQRTGQQADPPSVFQFVFFFPWEAVPDAKCAVYTIAHSDMRQDLLVIPLNSVWPIIPHAFVSKATCFLDNKIHSTSFGAEAMSWNWKGSSSLERLTELLALSVASAELTHSCLMSACWPEVNIMVSPTFEPSANVRCWMYRSKGDWICEPSCSIFCHYTM